MSFGESGGAVSAWTVGAVDFDRTDRSMEEAADDAEGETAERSWTRVIERIRAEYGEDIYRSWFKGVALVEANEFTVQLSVPTSFLRMWLRTNYGAKLLALWRAERPTIQRIDIRVRSVAVQTQGERPVADDASAAGTQPSSLKLIGKEAAAALPQPAAPGAGALESAPLDPRFTFENFALGPSNKIAHDTAFAVASGSGAAMFNPLFIHGGVGRGKTHLLHAIAWRAAEMAPQRRVLYLSAEQFVYRFVTALRDETAIDFKERLRGVDLLLIDDLQFLQGKATHREFGHTVNALVESCRQVVLVADRPPSELDGFDDRTRSRLAGGLVAIVGRQEVMLRRRILEARAAELRRQGQPLDLPEEVFDYVARSVASNGRELEGALNRLAAYHCFAGVKVTLELAEKVIRDLVTETERAPVKIEDIQRLVASHYQISRQDLVSNRRTRAIVLPRQVAMYLAKSMTLRSLPEIGRRFGNRDHTTVLHSIRKIERMVESDPALAREVESLRRRAEDGEA